eukprot:scaffold21907_cov57-Phaeocystis_antarctica.AAC.13
MSESGQSSGRRRGELTQSLRHTRSRAAAERQWWWLRRTHIDVGLGTDQQAEEDCHRRRDAWHFACVSRPEMVSDVKARREDEPKTTLGGGRKKNSSLYCSSVLHTPQRDPERHTNWAHRVVCDRRRDA